MYIKQINMPLTDEAVDGLRAGDRVLLSGKLYTVGDAAHKKLMQRIGQGERPPFSLANQVIYYAVATPPPPGRLFRRRLRRGRPAQPTRNKRTPGGLPRVGRGGRLRVCRGRFSGGGDQRHSRWRPAPGGPASLRAQPGYLRNPARRPAGRLKRVPQGGQGTLGVQSP